MTDLKSMTFAELCQLLHDVAEELAQRHLDIIALLNGKEDQPCQEGSILSSES